MAIAVCVIYFTTLNSVGPACTGRSEAQLLAALDLSDTAFVHDDFDRAEAQLADQARQRIEHFRRDILRVAVDRSERGAAHGIDCLGFHWHDSNGKGNERKGINVSLFMRNSALEAVDCIVFDGRGSLGVEMEWG